MLDILQTIHDEYIPVGRGTDRLTGEETVEVLEKVFFGGDQLTEERATNVRDARSDGDNEFERLQGVIPKVEDWHASRILYQVKKINAVFTFTTHNFYLLGNCEQSGLYDVVGTRMGSCVPQVFSLSIRTQIFENKLPVLCSSMHHLRFFLLTEIYKRKTFALH